IGGGIAGASLARALLHAGLSPVVFERTAPASGASGNPAGLIMPRLDAADTPAGRFHASAYLYTVQLLQRLQETTHAALFNPCGVVLHATSERERKRQSTLLAQHALPEGWIAPEKDGLFFPQGGVVHPPSFVRTLLGATPVRTESVMRIRRADAGWRIETGSNAGAAIFDAVVIANGLDALRFGQARSLPLAGAAGQVDWFPDISAPETARAFGPYAAPVRDGGLIIGATYAPIAISAAPSFTAEATDTTIKAVARTLPSLAARLDAKASRPRASVRCVTPDRLPVAGPAPDWGFYGGAYDGLRTGRRTDYPDGVMLEGMFILTGLGSRGLVTAPLAAAMITAEMTGAPAPVDFAVAEALHPARFFVRDLKRGKRAAK
ncbi:MAG: FAD-dependent 5-carboxymethylaminomethyl-2-thiouridine(34) oxidoreductase MnmC, partial [Hyphococcus sp.]